MDWLKKKDVKITQGKIDKPKPTTPPPAGQKWAWSADDKVWILVSASPKRLFTEGAWVAEVDNIEVLGKIQEIKGEEIFVDWGEIPKRLSPHKAESLILLKDKAAIPNKKPKVIEDSFSAYMNKRESVKKVLSQVLDKIKFEGSDTLAQRHIKGNERPLVFEIRGSVRKKGTRVIGKILDIRKDNSLEVDWEKGEKSIVWKQEVEPV